MRSWRDWSWADGNFWDSGVQPLLEGKESLFGKARKAAEIAIENMQGVIAEINRLEEEG